MRKNPVTITIQQLQCICAAAPDQAADIVYILYPMDPVATWLGEAAAQYGMHIVAISGIDWDNDLTPWPAPGVPAGSAPFKGLARDFLHTMLTSVVPQAEKQLDIQPRRRHLIGISLSGLWAVWQWTLCSEFDYIVSISGSFWYEGFVAWLRTAFTAPKPGKAFLMLGTKEGQSRVPAFRTIPTDTHEVLAILQAHTAGASLLMVPGNHYQHGLERITHGLKWLSEQP